MTTKNIKEQAREMFDEKFKDVQFIEFDKGAWSHDVKKYHDKEVRDFIDQIIDLAIAEREKEIVEMIEKYYEATR